MTKERAFEIADDFDCFIRKVSCKCSAKVEAEYFKKNNPKKIGEAIAIARENGWKSKLPGAAVCSGSLGDWFDGCMAAYVHLAKCKTDRRMIAKMMMAKLKYAISNDNDRTKPVRFSTSEIVRINEYCPFCGAANSMKKCRTMMEPKTYNKRQYVKCAKCGVRFVVRYEDPVTITEHSNCPHCNGLVSVSVGVDRSVTLSVPGKI